MGVSIDPTALQAAKDAFHAWHVGNGYHWNYCARAMEAAIEAYEAAKPKAARAEIMRLIREDFDPTPPNWEDREWNDNAEDVADKIIALFGSEKPTQVSDEPCAVCGGSGNIFTQKFDRDGNERLLRCPCKDGDTHG